MIEGVEPDLVNIKAFLEKENSLEKIG